MVRSGSATTDGSNPGRSEEAPLTDRNNQSDNVIHAIDLGLLAPLLVGMSAAVFFALIYTYLLQKLG